MTPLSLFSLLVHLMLLLDAAHAWRADAAAASSLAADAPGPLSPKSPRQEADEDRLVAAARYAHARALLNGDDRPGALRELQRAWRYDPASRAIAREIVSLASSLNRPDEAIRYAILFAERNPEDPALLRQLGALLVARREHRRALGMFRKAAELEKDKPPGLASVSLRVEMGRLHYLLDEPDKAAEVLAYVREALAHPDRFGLSGAERQQLLAKPSLLYGLMGESFLLAGRAEEAADMFRQAHADPSEEPVLAFQLARVHAARNEWDAAAKSLDRYLQAKTPAAGVAPYELLSQVLRETRGDEARAEADLLTRLQSLYREDSSNAPLARFLARKLLESGQLDASEKIWLELLKTKPASEILRALCQIYRPRADVDGLLRVLGQVAEQAESLAPLGPEIATITAEPKLVEQLLARSRKLLQDSPHGFPASQRLAVALLAIAAQRFEQAEEFYQAALQAESSPRAKVMESVGLAMHRAGQNERAAKILQQAIAEQPAGDRDQAAAYHYYLAGTLELAGDTEKALEAARKAAALRPESPALQVRAGWVLYHAKRYPEAEEEYRKFVAQHDAEHGASATREALREARLALANICVLGSRRSEAEEWLEQILDEFPEDISALNDLGYLWADQGRHVHRALEMVRRAVEAEPDNAAYRDSLGWAYYRLGRYQDAVRELEQAARGEHLDPVILDHLGDAYLAVQLEDKAVSAWRRAAEAFRAQHEVDSWKKTEAKIKKQAGGAR